jgi:Tfp pilus assembly protein PilW
MELLLGLLIGSVVAGGLVLRYWHQQDRIARIRDRARLKVIEGQMAALRVALRIQVAEHVVRQRMQPMHGDDVFRNSTNHEEYRPS